MSRRSVQTVAPAGPQELYDDSEGTRFRSLPDAVTVGSCEHDVTGRVDGHPELAFVNRAVVPATQQQEFVRDGLTVVGRVADVVGVDMGGSPGTGGPCRAVAGHRRWQPGCLQRIRDPSR